MRILMVTGTYPPSANGVAVSVKNISEELRRLGHKVFVLAPENKSAAKPDKYVIRYPSIDNPIIKDYPVPLFPLNIKVFQFLKETKFDIVHAQHPFYISYIADAVSSLKNIPFVFTYHTRYDKYIKTGIKILPKKLINKIEEYTFKGVFKKADLIIAPSNSAKKHLTEIADNSKIKVIPSGIPHFAKSHFSKTKLRVNYRVPQNKNIILCVSRIGKEKNTKMLIRAMEHLDNKHVLVLAGVGPWLEELKEYVKNKNMETKVLFLGKVNYEKIPEIYGLADIFAFPSISETQGLVLLEAGYFGLPIAAIDSPVNREFVKNDFGVLTANNPRKLAAAILKCFKNQKEFSLNAKNFAKKFTIEKVTGKFASEYELLIKKGKKKKHAIISVKEKIEELIK